MQQEKITVSIITVCRNSEATIRRTSRKALKRAGIKYRIYRSNGYSRFYAVECYGMEAAKLLL